MDLGGAVPAAPERQRGLPGREGFLAFEDGVFVGLGEVGGDDLEDLPAQDP